MKTHLYSLKLFLFVLFASFSVKGWGQYTGTGSFTKVTSLADLTDGYYVILNEKDTKIMTNGRSGSDTNGYYLSADVILTLGKVEDPSISNVWLISTDGTGKSIKNVATEKYVGWQSSNGASVETTVANTSRWTFSYASAKWTVNNVSTVARQLSHNATATRFAAYENTNQEELQFYKLDTPIGPTITLNPTTALALGNICQGTNTTTGSYTVSGSNLTNNIVLTPSANLEISKDNNFATAYTSSSSPALTLNQTGGSVSATTIYVRTLTSMGVGVLSNEKITHTSNGATTVTKDVSGTIVAASTPTVSISTANTTTCQGTDVAFNATTNNVGGGTVSYQWKLNGFDIVNANASTYTLSNPTTNDKVSCLVTVSGGCVTTPTASSNVITLTVVALPTAPSAPTITTACNSATASAVTSSQGTVYWQNSAGDTSITNSAASTRTFNAPGTYYLKTQNANGCWSSATKVDISFPQLIINNDVQNQSATVNNNATFSVTTTNATGYQWEKYPVNGSAWETITTNGTSSSYTVNNVQLTMSGDKYRVIVYGTTPCTNITSVEGVLTVISNTANDFRTRQGGTWSTGTAGTALWQKFNTITNTWDDITGRPTATTHNVFIRHSVNTNGNNAINNLTIENGGKLTSTHQATINGNLIVKSGGEYSQSAALNLQTTSIFEIEDDGTFKFSNTNVNPQLFVGIEKFHPESKFHILNFDDSTDFIHPTSTTNKREITPNTYFNPKTGGDYSALFGNLYYEDQAGGDMNLVTNIGSPSFNLTHRNLTIDSDKMDTNAIGAAANDEIRLIRGTQTIGLGGDVILKDGYFVFTNASSGNPIVNIEGDLIVGGLDNLDNATAVISGVANSGVSTVNVKGNLQVLGNARLASNDLTDSNLFFNNTNNVQTIEYNSSNSDGSNTKLNINVDNYAYVKLKNNDLALGTNSSFTVKSGGTLDFDFVPSSTTSLKIKKVESQIGQKFNLEAGGKLIITSKDGIGGNSATIGNVQVPTTDYSADATTFVYKGKVNQSTGKGLPSGTSTAGVGIKVIADLETTNAPLNDNLNLTIDDLIHMSSAAELDIRRGTVLDASSYGFDDATSQDAKLTMSSGRYKVSRSASSTQPALGGAYTLTGGVIEFAGSSGLNIRTNKDYLNVEVSGSNVTAGTTLNAGLSFLPNGSFRVTETGVFKVQNDNGFSGASNTAIKNTNSPSIVLDPLSTIEYSREGDQVITKAPTNIPNVHYQNLKISGSGVKTATGTTTVNNIVNVVAGELKLPETTDNIAANVLEAKKGIQNNGGTITFENNAILMQDTMDVSNIGKIKMLRNANVKSDQYNFWSSPLQGQNMYQIYAVPTSRVMVYNTATDTYSYVTGNSVSSTPGKGYSIKGPAANIATDALTATFDKTPNNGDVSYTLESTGKRFNLVGNPYPSNLDLDLLFEANSGTLEEGQDLHGINPTMYFWDNKGNPYTTQGNRTGQNYAVYNAVSGVGVAATNPSASTSKVPNGIVKPGQGFMVKAQTIGGTLLFTNAMRTTEFKRNSKDSPYYKTQTENDKFWLELETPTEIVNMTAVAYKTKAKNTFDLYDSMLMNTNAGDMLYTLSSDNVELGIQGRQGAFTNQDIILPSYL